MMVMSPMNELTLVVLLEPRTRERLSPQGARPVPMQCQKLGDLHDMQGNL